MNRLIFTVLAGALLAATCARADGLSDNQQFLRTLREQSAARQQMTFVPSQQGPGMPAGEDMQWIENMQQRMQSRIAPGSQARPDALYFLSFSIPEEGLKLMVPEAKRLHIPALVNGLIDNNFRKTVQAVFRLTRDKNAGGVQIDPVQFERYDIRAVPALVVTCEAGYDRLSGNLKLKEALARIAAEGECRDTARRLLHDAGEGE